MTLMFSNTIHKQHSCLVGHTDVSKLEPNPTGTLLASGGMSAFSKSFLAESCQGVDGTFIWSVSKSTPIRTPQFAPTKGSTSTFCWVTGPNDHFETLSMGTSYGYVLLWSQSSNVS